MKIYPWQSSVWQRLSADPHRLPHALLLEGPAGIGKRDFSLALAAALLCAKPLTQAGGCGRCPSCHWFRAGTHPDFCLLEPLTEEGGEEEGGQPTRKKREITVAQVRALENFVNLSSVGGGARVVVLSPADALNPAAANALLKTLEEPGPATYFLLVTDQAQRLLPTVRSRCQRLSMPRPSQALARDWLARSGIPDAELCLALAGGAPLRAQALADGICLAERRRFLEALAEPPSLNWLELAERAAKVELVPCLQWLQTWVYDLMAVKLTGRIRYNQDFASCLQELGTRANVVRMHEFLRQLNQTKRFAQHPLNVQLVLEDLLLGYRSLIRP